MTDIGLLVGAAITIMIWSFAFKDTIIFRLAQTVYLGVALGYTAFIGITTIQNAGVLPISEGHISLLIPIILGLGVFGMISRKYYWVSRFPLATAIGISFGLFITGQINQILMPQVASLMKVPTTINEVVTLICAIAALFYFLFTYELKGTAANIPKICRWILMLGFGSLFGNMVMFRVNLLGGKFLDILAIFGL